MRPPANIVYGVEDTPPRGVLIVSVTHRDGRTSLLFHFDH
jgi:hypothetical protein